MDNKKFKMIDENFKCFVCGKEVKTLEYTARDHCPYCLASKHVDVNPGDRACLCLGVLEAIGVEKGKKDTLKIIYKCQKCGMIKRNKMAIDDNYDLILKLSSNPVDIP